MIYYYYFKNRTPQILDGFYLHHSQGNSRWGYETVALMQVL